MNYKKIWRKFKYIVKKGISSQKKEEEKKIEFYHDPCIKTIDVLHKQECCGCSSCSNICPVNAIKMFPDEEGFLYPTIDYNICIQCGKCQKVCPSLQVKYENSKEPYCYAAMADNEIRAKSSSGGMFTVLADYIFEKGGYVAGAAYDENFAVHHILINSPEELDKLRISKYVQSDTQGIYPKVKSKLSEGYYVLFSGCPCQIAGLNAFLGKDYEKLLTVDLVCHGVPSPKAFAKYLKDSFPGKEFQKINFRDKKAFGWSSHMNIYFKDGTTHLEHCNINSYYRAFLSGLSVRPSCSVCKYTTLPRQADISIGDFWGISNHKPEMTDAQGTSLVIVNSGKGKAVFEAVKNKIMKVEQMNLSQARPKNQAIDRPFEAHPNHSRFFRLLNIYPFDKAVEYALKRKFDIGVIGLWYGRNYGSMITYYALHRKLTSMGLSVLMINNPFMGKDVSLTKTHPRKFAKEFYEISKVHPLSELWKLNEHCDAFMVGSDQLWNYDLSKPYNQYYFLSFADDNKKKIAYGTSFGKDKYTAPEGYHILSAQNMKRFDYVSVREDFAVDMCRDIFGVEAQFVTDPVFFCRDKEYAEIESERPECSGNYILAYILDPNKEKTKALLHVAQRLNMQVKVILDELPDVFQENKKRMEITEDAPIEILEEVDIKEWLYCFHHSSYVVTDSFHGTCFSIIFHKNFTAIANAMRGSLRFRSLLKKFHMEDRLIFNAEKLIDHPMIEQSIDYDKIYEYIDAEVEASAKWLENAVFSPKAVKSYTSYQIIDKRAKENE